MFFSWMDWFSTIWKGKSSHGHFLMFECCWNEVWFTAIIYSEWKRTQKIVNLSSISGKNWTCLWTYSMHDHSGNCCYWWQYLYSCCCHNLLFKCENRQKWDYWKSDLTIVIMCNKCFIKCQVVDRNWGKKTIWSIYNNKKVNDRKQNHFIV